MKESKSGKF